MSQLVADAPASQQLEAIERDCSSIASILLDSGALQPDQLRHGLRVHGKLGGDVSLVSVLRDLGLVEEHQVLDVVREHPSSIPLGALLVELGYLSRDQLRKALRIQKNQDDGTKIGEILVRKRVVKEHDLVRILASQLGMEYAEPDISGCEESLLNRLSANACERYGFFPVRRADNAVVVAFADPRDEEAIETARKVLQADIQPAMSTATAIKTAAQALARRAESREQSRDRRKVDDRSSPAAYVDQIIQLGIQEDASDIHVEPLRDRVRVRLRCDGVLREQMEFPRDALAGVTSRLKVLATADIAEKRRHQDGRILYEHPRTGETVDLRASFYVTVHGEAVVMRLLKSNMTLLNLSQLGMTPTMLGRFRDHALEAPSGVIVVTGPTGSGKTTTLYSCVNHLNDEYTSIITAEDPVEYQVDGISQCSLNPKLDRTYEETLKHIVRQDPDVIVLGEIRDQFSAESAIQAALTGHKVLTTFHTEDSIGALLRLMNMQIEPFLIASTIASVLAQRLVRRVCGECASERDVDARLLQLVGWTRGDCRDAAFRRGTGCEHCQFTGYKGRVAVFESLLPSEAVRDAITNGESSSKIRELSLESTGMLTLLEDGLLKAARGETTLEEVRRHLPKIGTPRPLNELQRMSGLSQ